MKDMESHKLTLFEQFWDKEKTKIQRRFFVDKNNLLQGEYKSWHRNGQLESYFNYKDDNEFGECIWYFKNGQIDQILNYKNGIQHGKHQSWIEFGWRIFIETHHHKKGEHGTEVEFK